MTPYLKYKLTQYARKNIETPATKYYINHLRDVLIDHSSVIKHNAKAMNTNVEICKRMEKQVVLLTNFIRELQREMK